MNRTIWTIVLALGLLRLPAVRADQAEENAKIKTVMIENYLLYREAFKERDADRMISFESPDYTSVDSDGRVYSKQDTDIVWRDVMRSIVKVYEVRVEIKKVLIEPNRVIVLHKDYTDYDGYWDNKQLSRIKITGDVSDTWVKYDGEWMLKRSRDWEAVRLVDGKPR